MDANGRDKEPEFSRRSQGEITSGPAGKWDFTDISSIVGGFRPLFLRWWSVVECGGVWWSVVECGGGWWSVVECGGVWWSVVEGGGGVDVTHH
jgi:hypothetical protein